MEICGWNIPLVYHRVVIPLSTSFSYHITGLTVYANTVTSNFRVRVSTDMEALQISKTNQVKPFPFKEL